MAYDQRCANCANFGSEPPEGRMPGVGSESRRCLRKRVEKSTVEWRRPSDWCHEWRDKG